jgi:hypothetical protein
MMEKVRQTPSKWKNGTVRLEVNHTETLLNHMGWEEEMQQVNVSTFVKGMDFHQHMV